MLIHQTLKDAGFKITITRTEDGKNNRAWYANKRGISIRGHNMTSEFDLYLMNNAGGHVKQRYKPGTYTHYTQTELLKMAMTFIPPEKILGYETFGFNEVELGTTHLRQNSHYACLDNVIMCCRVIGIAGVKYPKIALDWVQEPGVEVQFVMQGHTYGNGKFTFLTDSEKVMLCKIKALTKSDPLLKYSRPETVGHDISFLRGSTICRGEADLIDLSTTDQTIIKKAIELYIASPNKWIGVKI